MVLPPKAVSTDPQLPVWEGEASAFPTQTETNNHGMFVPAEPTWFMLASFLVVVLMRYLRSKNTPTGSQNDD